MKGINSRAKGARGELKVASWLNDAGWDAHRTQQHCGMPSHQGTTAGVPDVLIPEIPKLHIEVKFCERTQIDKWMEKETRAVGATDSMPVVVHKKNHCEPYVTMRFKDFAPLLNEIKSLLETNDGQ